ncbi:Hypothetical predicted protein [Olea europaea subsp. europaea]|uniref:Uncharacterized protein n=1 Tax=Olea europaea subsp. europaea TaxID=158383 RepID=A0A8S0Q0V0_OLEEU|nr:Hypothetical predicted protein [Olea europaea subsp. europaea]
MDISPALKDLDSHSDTWVNYLEEFISAVIEMIRRFLCNLWNSAVLAFPMKTIDLLAFLEEE